MSPKVVNGSFAALFDNGDDWSRKLLRSEMKDSSCKYSITGIITIINESNNIILRSYFSSNEKKNSRDFDVGKTVFFGFTYGSSSGNGSSCIEESNHVGVHYKFNGRNFR